LPPAEPVAAPEATTDLPAVESEFSEADLEAELARTILPRFKQLPEELRGRGDRVVVGEQVYEDVYVSESSSQYLLRIPEQGRVESVDKIRATVTLAANTDDRKALLVLWKENRTEIDRATERRDKEKKLRVAAHNKAQEEIRVARRAAQKEERWRVKGAEWLSLTAEQRHTSRMRAYSNWRAIQADVDAVQELHANIAWGYRIIGISDSRARRLGEAYQKWAKVVGPNFDVEDELLAYGWGREEILREMGKWEREYYRVLEHVNEVYPTYEARVEEIQRLDDGLPPELRRTEAVVDWDSALEGDDAPAGETGGSVGTGFVVADGYVMTCAHVVRHGSNIQATSTKGTIHQATVVTMDTANDWALLKVEGLSGAPIPVAEDKPNVGATIYCLGYPLGGIKGSADPIVGSGNIAALQRLDGDQRFIQITAPVNPGNSGGPVLDQYGRWVGIVSQKLNDMRSLEASETVAQGINFAVKATFIQPMLDPSKGVKFTPFVGDISNPMSLEKIAASVAPSIVKIEVR
ncbi:MAG: serine protease, partial [Candidatus Hydrogenedentes bacterium]|nr:serine protease [Candidatus Hydrogenedentota bacterium]